MEVSARIQHWKFSIFLDLFLDLGCIGLQSTCKKKRRLETRVNSVTSCSSCVQLHVVLNCFLAAELKMVYKENQFWLQQLLRTSPLHLWAIHTTNKQTNNAVDVPRKRDSMNQRKSTPFANICRFLCSNSLTMYECCCNSPIAKSTKNYKCSPWTGKLASLGPLLSNRVPGKDIAKLGAWVPASANVEHLDKVSLQTWIPRIY